VKIGGLYLLCLLDYTLETKLNLTKPLFGEFHPIIIHSKKCWVVLTQFWVKYGQTQPLGYIFKLHF